LMPLSQFLLERDMQMNLCMRGQSPYDKNICFKKLNSQQLMEKLRSCFF
jgi:hypothetical protein